MQSSYSYDMSYNPLLQQQLMVGSPYIPQKPNPYSNQNGFNNYSNGAPNGLSNGTQGPPINPNQFNNNIPLNQLHMGERNEQFNSANSPYLQEGYPPPPAEYNDFGIANNFNNPGALNGLNDIHNVNGNGIDGSINGLAFNDSNADLSHLNSGLNSLASSSGTGLNNLPVGNAASPNGNPHQQVPGVTNGAQQRNGSFMGNPANDLIGTSAPSRTVYLGNVPPDISPEELLNHVRSGIIENVRILPSKMCAFISFIDESSALLFHSDAILKRLTIKNNDIRIGWGKSTQIAPAVLNSIQRDGATRNVYLGNLSKDVTADELKQDLSKFGQIDTVKILAEKGVAFVHFLSILSAVRVVQQLPLEEKYVNKKIFYGKDRCAFITKTQQHNAAQYLGLAPGMEHLVTAADRDFISNALVQQQAAAAAIATSAGGVNNLGNRTVYLGSLHPDSSIEEICNVVRGGLLQTIRYLSERHVCFITFIDPIAAAQFFAMCHLHGLTIHNRRVKVGWGKHSGPLPNPIALAVSSGASRNIYIGNIERDLENIYVEPKLRKDFGKFGEIEQINFLPEKKCAFVNFTNIANAIKAIDGIKMNEDYKNFKINYGKDRCGNMPRQFQSLNGAAAAAAAGQTGGQVNLNSNGYAGNIHSNPGSAGQTSDVADASNNGGSAGSGSDGNVDQSASPITEGGSQESRLEESANTN